MRARRVRAVSWIGPSSVTKVNVDGQVNRRVAAKRLRVAIEDRWSLRESSMILWRDVVRGMLLATFAGRSPHSYFGTRDE